MRKLVTGVLLLLMVATFVVATGEEETVQVGPVKVGLWGATDRPMYPDNPDSLLFYGDYLLGDIDTEITFYAPGESGADHPIKLEVAAGTQPDVYLDYLGRTSIFANERYAHDITPLVGQEVLDQYLPSFLGLMNKEGVQYGLPETAWISVMIVNATLLERVGMLDVVADGQWTIDEFVEASRRVAALGDGYYGYVMFSASTGGDYWYLGFIPGFGAALYENNRIALNNEAGIAAMQFYSDFAEEGLAPPGAAALTHTDFLSAYTTGKILAFANGPSMAGDEAGQAAFDAGKAEEAYKSILMPFPTAEGVDKAPLAMGPDGVMIFNKGYAPSQATVDVLLALTGYRSQAYRSKQNVRFSSLKALADARPSDPLFLRGAEILEQNGAWDMGIGLRTYGPVRQLVPPMFQAIFTGELTVEEAVTRFELDGNEILSRED